MSSGAVSLFLVTVIGIAALALMFPDLPDRFDNNSEGMLGFLFLVSMLIWVIFIFPILVLAAVY